MKKPHADFTELAFGLAFPSNEAAERFLRRTVWPGGVVQCSCGESMKPQDTFDRERFRCPSCKRTALLYSGTPLSANKLSPWVLVRILWLLERGQPASRVAAHVGVKQLAARRVRDTIRHWIPRHLGCSIGEAVLRRVSVELNAGDIRMRAVKAWIEADPEFASALRRDLSDKTDETERATESAVALPPFEQGEPVASESAADRFRALLAQTHLSNDETPDEPDDDTATCLLAPELVDL